MKDRGRNAFTPTDLCGLIAHETAALLYGVDCGVPASIGVDIVVAVASYGAYARIVCKVLRH